MQPEPCPTEPGIPTDSRFRTGPGPVGNLRFTLLTDLKAAQRGLRTEHGFALWIEAEGRRILFDTGRSDLLIRNAKRLGIPLEQTDAVVLSHGHDDHAGGLQAVLDLAPQALLYLHPRACLPRYAQTGKADLHPVGMPQAYWDKILGNPARLRWTSSRVSLFPGAFITGPIPKEAAENVDTGQYWLDAEGRQPDVFLDDQALWFCTSRGPLAVLGCAHVGVLNTLREVQRHARRDQVFGFIGGLHLGNATPEQITATVNGLEGLGIQSLAPCHCTGEAAETALRQAFGPKMRELRVGDTWEPLH